MQMMWKMDKDILTIYDKNQKKTTEKNCELWQYNSRREDQQGGDRDWRRRVGQVWSIDHLKITIVG